MRAKRLLSATVEAVILPATLVSAEVKLTAPDTLDAGQPLAAKVTISSDAPEAAVWKVTCSLQADSGYYNVPPPDPVYGADRALGAESWTVCNGKVIERGSLTDGLDYTEASTEWSNDGFTEAFQYVDLGQARQILRLVYRAGDANHLWKADVAVSLDNQAYLPVPGAQGVDLHQKWGLNVIPVSQPVWARFLRLRYHNGGQKVPCFRLPASLSVYDGAAAEKWELPNAGPEIGTAELTCAVPARSRVEAPLPIDKPLSPGLYLLAGRFSSGTRKELAWRRLLVLPTAMPSISPDSRFGINAAKADWAPILRRLGVGWVRFENLKWPFVSLAPGQYCFDGTGQPWSLDTDTVLKQYTAQGLSVLPFLFMTAPYASSAPPGVKDDRRPFYPPKDNGSFAEFAFQATARYGARTQAAAGLKTTDGKSGLGYLGAYELWNEPNLTNAAWGPWVGTSGQFFELFRAGAEAVKRADPTAKVTSAGYAGIQVRTVDELRTYSYADGRHPLDFIDVLNVHFYSGRVAPELATDDANAQHTGDRVAEDEFRRLIAWRDKVKPGLPIWLSETGYDSAGPFGTDERTQCARLPRVILLALSTGIAKVFVYRESGSAPMMHAASGLLREDGAFKPAFLTYATLIRELDGVKGGAIRLPLTDRNMRLYAWQSGSGWILTAWMIEGAGKLAVDLGQATVTDAFGRRTAQDLTHGMDLTIFPAYIRDVSNQRAISDLLAESAQERARQANRRQRLAQAEAYVLKFGGQADSDVLDFGRERHYTPVLGAEVYAEARGYGFAPNPAADELRPWVSSELDRTDSRLSPGQEFRLRVKPGKYRLRLGVSPFNDANLLIKGAAGGDIRLAVAKGDLVVERDLEAGAAPLSLALDAYSLFRWLTLVERLPGE